MLAAFIAGNRFDKDCIFAVWLRRKWINERVFLWKTVLD